MRKVTFIITQYGQGQLLRRSMTQMALYFNVTLSEQYDLHFITQLS